LKYVPGNAEGAIVWRMICFSVGTEDDTPLEQWKFKGESVRAGDFEEGFVGEAEHYRAMKQKVWKATWVERVKREV
jgi:hypothetical protein